MEGRSKFRQRNPEITGSLITWSAVVQKQKLLSSILTFMGMCKSPRQLHNYDKTFVPLDCSREKPVTLKRSNNTYMQV